MNGIIRKTKLNYLLAIFAIAIVISTIASPNISITLAGQYNRSDGAISWLCYIALMFIAMNINYPKNAVNKVLYSLYPFIFINFFIITMNFTGNDLMQKEWIQKIVTVLLPEGASIAEDSQLVGTLNQWNYMSGMFAIMTVMFLAAAIVGKNLLISIINIICATFSIAVMLMSISTSGFLTVLIMVVPILVLIMKAENKIQGIIILGIFLVLSSITLHILSKENPVVWRESIGFFVDKNPYEQEEKISKATNGFEIDLLNKAYASDNTFELPKLPGRSWAPGTGRLYIWEKTLNLFKERPIFGYGLDSLMYNFPHYNIDARAGLFTEHTITDKPHSVYVGILYGTGIIGFIAFLLIVGIIIISSIKILFNRKIIYLSILSIGSIAFFIQAIFNDSLPGTSGVMWALTGILFGLILSEKEGVKS